MKNNIKEFRAELITLLKALKKEITSETLVETGDGPRPGIELTIGYRINKATNEIDWDYQTGSNEYSGAAYFYHYWAVTTLFPRTNCTVAAQEIIDQMVENG